MGTESKEHPGPATTRNDREGNNLSKFTAFGGQASGFPGFLQSVAEVALAK